MWDEQEVRKQVAIGIIQKKNQMRVKAEWNQLHSETNITDVETEPARAKKVTLGSCVAAGHLNSEGISNLLTQGHVVSKEV